MHCGAWSRVGKSISLTSRNASLFSLDIVWISMFNYSEIEKQTDCLKHQDHGVSTFLVSLQVVFGGS